MFVRKLTAVTSLGALAGALLLGGGLTFRGPANAGADPDRPRADAPRPAPEATALPAPVTVSRSVRREFTPFEDFTGRLAFVPDPRGRPAERAPGPGGVNHFTVLGVLFDVGEGSYRRFKRSVSARQIDEKGTVLHVALSDEHGFPHEASLLRFDSEFNEATGTIRAKAILNKPDDLMLPGMFARVRLTLGKPRPALMLPDAALVTDQGDKYVYVVNDRNVAERRAVKVGQADDGLRVIEEGLRPDHWVVTAGLRGVKPGAKVDPHRAPEPGAKPPAKE